MRVETHCHKKHGEPVNIKRVRELRLQIQNELRESESMTNFEFSKEHKQQRIYASP